MGTNTATTLIKFVNEEVTYEGSQKYVAYYKSLGDRITFLELSGLDDNRMKAQIMRTLYVTMHRFPHANQVKPGAVVDRHEPVFVDDKGNVCVSSRYASPSYRQLSLYKSDSIVMEECYLD